MKRTSQTVQRGREGKERIRQSRTHKFSSVGRNVSTFVVTVDGNIQPHQLDEGFIVTEAKKGRKIGRVILIWVDGRELAIAINVAVDTTGDVGELGDKVHRIFECGTPVVFLGDTILVGFGKGRVVVKLSIE